MTMVTSDQRFIEEGGQGLKPSPHGWRETRPGLVLTARRVRRISVGRLRELRADSVPGRALSTGTKRLTTWVPRAETQNNPAHQSVGKEKEPGARGGWNWVGPR